MTGAVVLAAGKGTRLRSSQAKVLHRLAGRSLLRWVLEALRPLGLDRVVVVVGHQADAVAAEARAADIPGLVTVVQHEQNGTGHAVRVAVEAGVFDGIEDLLVLPGDAPAITTGTLTDLLASRGDAAAVVLTTELDDATGYGRIIRSPDGTIMAIVEHRDASADQLAVREVNTALFAFRLPDLIAALAAIGTENDQGEEYLTDTVAILASSHTVRGAVAPAEDVQGINDRAHMAEVEAIMRHRILTHHMRNGVTVTDPSSTYIDADVVVEPDATILPGTMLHGTTRIASAATVGPYSRLTDTQVDESASVMFSVAVEAVIGPWATVGPYTYLRPGTVLGAGSKAGGFVEMKKAVIGEGSKVPHLSYVGDARIGDGVNLGAGTITVNYDGFAKHATTIGDGAFIGSDTMLIAPIDVGAGAFVAAGSTISSDVPADALVVERSKARTIDGWAARRRARHAAQTAPPVPPDETPA